MPTLRRILKYTPAVVLGLLVLAWVCSTIGWLEYLVRFDGSTIGVGLGESTLGLWSYPDDGKFIQQLHWSVDKRQEVGLSRFAGYLRYAYPRSSRLTGVLHLPIPMAATSVLPLAIGPFLSFRFRTWHYLAYTVLVAVELAYYLRWQE